MSSTTILSKPRLDFETWLDHYSHKTLILNVKEEGLEERLIASMASRGIDDFFFLDQSFPFLIKWSKLGEHRCAVRVSEFENIETRAQPGRTGRLDLGRLFLALSVIRRPGSSTRLSRFQALHCLPGASGTGCLAGNSGDEVAACSKKYRGGRRVHKTAGSLAVPDRPSMNGLWRHPLYRHRPSDQAGADFWRRSDCCFAMVRAVS